MALCALKKPNFVTSQLDIEKVLLIFISQPVRLIWHQTELDSNYENDSHYENVKRPLKSGKDCQYSRSRSYGLR